MAINIGGNEYRGGARYKNWQTAFVLGGLASTSTGLDRDWTWLASNQVHLDLAGAVIISLSDTMPCIDTIGNQDDS